MKKDLLAYMCVLDYQPVLQQVGRGISWGNVGCLVRLQDALKQKNNNPSTELLAIIQHREKINGTIPNDLNKLAEATKKCAEACLKYYQLLGGRMTPRTDKELRELAFYIFENKVFGTWAFRDDREMKMLVGNVFMPFMFMAQEDKKTMVDAKVIHMYEFYDQAGPRSINGYPIFWSMKLILEEEWKKITKYVDELGKQRSEFMGEEEPEVNWHEPMGE